jgi:DNA-binding XRE family transcriptional regulator
MSWIENVIAEECAKSKEYAETYYAEKEKHAVAVALRRLRESEGLTQQELADLAHKPQSTIARIERGTMNPSFKLLSDIARSVGKHLEIQFV